MFRVSGRDGLFAAAATTMRVGSEVRRALWAAAPHGIARPAALFRLPGLGRGAVALTAGLGRYDPASAAAAGAVLGPLVYAEPAALRRAGVVALALGKVADVYPGAWPASGAGACRSPGRRRTTRGSPPLPPGCRRERQRAAAPVREAHLWTEIERTRRRGRVA
jgi:hypothetical protein